MDLHHKEQLHDNVSMMQAQHYSVSYKLFFGLNGTLKIRTESLFLCIDLIISLILCKTPLMDQIQAFI
jgi:hypothetical protein